MKRMLERLSIKRFSLKTILIASFGAFILISVVVIYLLTTGIYHSIDTRLLGNFGMEALVNKSSLLDMNLRQFDQLSESVIADPTAHEMITLKENNTYQSALLFRQFGEQTPAIAAVMLHNPYLLNITMRSKYNVYYSPLNTAFTGQASDGTDIGRFDNMFYRKLCANGGKITFIGTAGYRFRVNDSIQSFVMGRLINELDGTNSGYLLMFINAQIFDDLLDSASTSFGKGSCLNVFAPDGSLIYANPAGSVSTDFIRSQSGKLSAGEQSRIINYQGSAYLISRYTSQYTGWTLVNMTPMSYLTSQTNFNRALVVLFCAFFIVLAVLVAAWISGRITKPIHGIILTMRGISQGNLSLRTAIFRGSETEELSQRFNSMIDKINALIKENELKQKNIARAELSMLQAQINPHFLYNTLNSIRWLCILNKQDQIKNMVDSLAQLTMHTFSQVDSLIPVRTEIEILQSYVTLMKVRYTNFDCEVQVDDVLLDKPILRLLLQPFVENAIIHGFRSIDYVGRIVIGIHAQAGGIEVLIADNGSGIPEDIKREIIAGKSDASPKFSSIGIPNVFERIHLIYGKDCECQLGNNCPTGTVVKITLPTIHED